MYTPSQRFEALAYYFGWQGGTIHQIEQAIGCSNVLHRALYDGNGDGFSAVRTCGLQHRSATLTPKYRNDWSFWSAVVRGYWATGALGGPEFSKRFGN